MKKTSTKKLVITIVILAVAVALSIVIFMALSLFGKLNQVNNSISAAGGTTTGTTDSDTALAAEDGLTAEDTYDLTTIDTDIVSDQDITNILLIGQDRREDEDDSTTTRADTLIILTINSKTNEISLTSLMRDMYVPIPGYDSNRINAVYVLGGMELLDQTIEQDFGVQIDGNIEVDFEGFLTALAGIGPLTVTLTEEEAAYMTANVLDGVDSSEQEWVFTEGENVLYSSALLEYARMRYVGNSDWDRTARQRNLITLAFKKVKTMNIFSLLNLANNILPTLTTDISTSDLLGYVYGVMNNDMKMNGESMRLPIDGGYESMTVNGMSVLVPDLEMNAEALQEYIYGEVLNAVSGSYSEGALDEESMSETLYAADNAQTYDDYNYSDNTYYSADDTSVDTDAGYSEADVYDTTYSDTTYSDTTYDNTTYDSGAGDSNYYDTTYDSGEYYSTKAYNDSGVVSEGLESGESGY